MEAGGTITPLADGVQRLELLLGRMQHRALRTALLRLGRMRAGEVEVAGARMPYLERGSGPPVVMVHGFGGDKETWLLMAMRLSRRWRLVAPDLPGYGAASAIGGEHASARRQAAFVAGFLDRLGVRSAHVVGNSMGGGIALRLARDCPDRVRSLTLIASAGPEIEKSEVGHAIDRGENPLIPRYIEAADEFIELVTRRPPRVPRAMRRFIAAERVAARERLAELFVGWRESPPEEDIPDDLEAIIAPALVIHGTHDRVIHTATARALARRLPRSELLLLHDVGHLPQVEVPGRVARLVEQRLRSFEAGYR